MYTFTIKLFGAIKADLDSDQIKLQNSKEKLNLIELKREIGVLFPNISKVSTYKVAVNSEIYDKPDRFIRCEDEIALLPPYAGG